MYKTDSYSYTGLCSPVWLMMGPSTSVTDSSLFLLVHTRRKQSGRFSMPLEIFDPTDFITGPLHRKVGPSGHGWGHHIYGALQEQEINQFLLRTICETYRPLVDMLETFQFKRFWKLESTLINQPQLSAVGTHDDRRDLHIVFWVDKYKSFYRCINSSNMRELAE